MARKLVFSVFFALAALAFSPVHAQQDTYQYGGSTDPFGAAATDAAAGLAPAAKASKYNTSPVYVGGGPINLRSGAYIPHDPQQQYQDPAQQQTAPKPNSTLIYNQSLQDGKRLDQYDQSPFPPGWGEFQR